MSNPISVGEPWMWAAYVGFVRVIGAVLIGPSLIATRKGASQ
ncbi:MAG: hypothetical protein U1C96_01405 [Gallionella sp.]|nr:hypothetical protein [Gallionella sp.]